MSKCQWFLKCTRPAVTTLEHPILGAVPICQECKDKIERLSPKEEVAHA